MKQHRWFILGLCFLLLNGFAVFRWLGGHWNRADAHVTLLAPADSRLEAGSSDVIRWSFSDEMVPLERVGSTAESGPVRLLPDVPGEFCWTTTQELTFRPLEPWPPCSRYSVIMDKGLQSLDDRMVAGDHITALSTTPLALLDVRQSSLPTSGQLQLDLDFNAPVSVRDLKKCMSVKTATDQTLPVQNMYLLGKNTIRATFPLPDCKDLVVTLEQGLNSSAGPLGLEQSVTKKIHVSRALRILHLRAKNRPFESGQVEVTLNAPVQPAAARDFIHIEPGMDFTVETRDAWSGMQHLRILGDFKAGQQYRITFTTGLVGEQDIRLENDDSRMVYFPPSRPALEFTARGTYLSTQGNLAIPLKTVNTGPCSVRIHRVYANNLVQLAAREAGRAGYYYGDITRGLGQLVAEFDLPVDAPADTVTDCLLNLRPWLQEKTGVFHIGIRGERGGYASQDVVVSDLGLSLRQSDRDMLVWVNSIRSLDAAEGAMVKIYSAENQLLLSGTTDIDGLVRLDPSKISDDGVPFLVVVEHQDDLTCMRLDHSAVDLGGAVGERNYLKGGYEAFLFTDRGIYRPGETMHVEAVVRNRNAECPQAFPLELTVVRPDGKKDRTLSGLLSEQGTVLFDVPVADFAATGRYQLQARLPGADAELGVITVSVEEFVPPQIRTLMHIPEGRVDTARSFDITVEGHHLFGRPAENLTVAAKVDFVPCNFEPKGWEEYHFGDERRRFEAIHRALGWKTLDSDGRALFTLSASDQWKPPAALHALVSGAVQETGGRTVSAFGSRVIDVYPSYIGIRRPAWSPATGEVCEFDFAVVAPDGTLLPGAGSLSVHVEKLNWVTVMRKEGDHYAYRSEQQATEVESRPVTLNGGRAKTSFVLGHAGRYRLSVEHPENGTASSVEFSVHAPGQRWAERSMSAPDRVELELDRDQYEVGDRARLSIRSPFPGKALLTVESDQVLMSRVILLTNNAVDVELPVESAYRPNVYCSVSVVRPALPEETWGQHRAAGRIPLLVGQPDKKLDIALELPGKIRPATQLGIPLQVRDASGQGCAAEVVLAAVDEGICMLSGFETPDPFNYFFRSAVARHATARSVCTSHPGIHGPAGRRRPRARWWYVGGHWQATQSDQGAAIQAGGTLVIVHYDRCRWPSMCRF